MVVPQRPACSNRPHDGGGRGSSRDCREVKAARSSVVSWMLALGRWDSNPLPSRVSGRGTGSEASATCSSFLPVVTAHARRGPPRSDVVRTQHGPARAPAPPIGSGPVRSRTPSALLALHDQGPDRPAGQGKADQARRRGLLGLQSGDNSRHAAQGVGEGCRLLRELKGDVSGGEVCTAARWLVRVRPGQRPASRRTQTTSCPPLAPRNLLHHSPGGVVPRCPPGRGQGR
jgi:hypothetical protein